MGFLLGALGVGLPYLIIGFLVGAVGMAIVAFKNDFFGIRKKK